MPLKRAPEEEAPAPKKAKMDLIDELWHHYSLTRALAHNHYSIRYKRSDGTIESLKTGTLVNDGTIKIESVISKD